MREPCGQSLFAPCPTDCTRNCSARSLNVAEQIIDQRIRANRRFGIGAVAAATLITLSAAGAIAAQGYHNIKAVIAAQEPV